MEMKLLFLAATLAVASANFDDDTCPKSCICTERSYNKAIARCTLLDPKLQRFSPLTTHLVISDLEPSSPFSLTENIFSELGLENIKSIEILNSSLKEVHENAFHGLSSLSEIDLSNNDIMHISQQAFSKNPELRRLILKGNPLKLPENDYFIQHEYLTELDLSHCEIDQIYPATFSKLEGIETLILSNNKLKDLDPDVFRKLDFLEDISLAFNQISYIAPGTFSDNEDMNALSLRGNPITTLDELNVPDLKELDVSQCQIRGLSSTSLEGVSQINLLNLSHNHIESIDSEAFNSLVDLVYIHLSNNNLKGPLSEYLFEHNAKLEIISLSGNQKLGILEGFKGDFTNLYHYDISNCGLVKINNNTFRGMHFLATLNASGNALQHVDSKTFQKLRQLNTLDLSNNNLRYLPLKIFNTNLNLHKLYLGYNQFHHMPAALFLNTPELYSLDLRYCKLGYLWNVSESVMMQQNEVLRNLVYLNVAGNRLKKLHLQNFISLTKLGQLDISKNPIECSSSFAHVIEWLILHRVLPNKKRAEHPISMSEQIYNNVLWDDTFKSVCPTPDGPPSDTENVISQTEITFKPNVFFDRLQMNPSEEQPEIANLKIDESSTYFWPLSLIAFASLCLIFAVCNIAFLIVYKARHNYRLVSYKSHYPNPLGGLSQVRLKNSHTYQKLYEECSVPKTPIVKNSHGKFVVTCIGDPEKAEAV